MTSKPKMVGVAAMVLVAAFSAAARGDLVVSVAESGGFVASPYLTATSPPHAGVAPFLSVNSGNNVQVGDFQLTFSSNDSGSTPSLGDLTTSDIDLQNLGAVAESITFTIVNGQGTAATDYSLPTGSPLLLKSVLSVSQLPDDGSVTLLSSFTSGLGVAQPAPLNSVGFPGPLGPGTSKSSVPVLNPAGIYSLEQVITIFVPSGGQVSLTADTQVVAPEPPRVVGILSLAGMMGLGLFWQRRRAMALHV
ncbi:MAG TPA: hypothetical protein VGY55_01565 [Pirellulales bacterium]|jgi:hypothetical protein|nr:hypothetical protein [Pirellulales bacterium]